MSQSSLSSSPRHLQKNSHEQTQRLDIAHLLQVHYALENVTIKVLTGELDGNYYISVPQQAPYLLKICQVNPQNFTDIGIRVFPYLQTYNPKIVVQQIMPLQTGQLYEFLSIENQTYVFYLLTFIEGSTVAQHPSVQTSFYRDLGQQMAWLDEALEHLVPVQPAEPLWWDLQHLPKLHDFLPFVPNEYQQQIAAIMEEYVQMCKNVGSQLPRQMIHNDFNPHNLVVDSAGATVTGILDFGDMVDSYRVHNLAIASSYFFTADSSDPLRNILPLVHQYHATHPLSEVEQQVFLTCVAARLATTMLITHRRVHIHPENSSYILRNVPPTLLGLDFFARSTPTLRTHYTSLLFSGN